MGEMAPPGRKQSLALDLGPMSRPDNGPRGASDMHYQEVKACSQAQNNVHSGSCGGKTNLTHTILAFSQQHHGEDGFQTFRDMAKTKNTMTMGRLGHSYVKEKLYC